MTLPKKVFIIAEAGVNHNGSLDIARKMVDAASEAGADAIKFQTFRAEKLETLDERVKMLKKLELGESEQKELKEYCAEKNIIFLSTPFDGESVDMLNRLGVEAFKIPSGEITNLPYLRKIGALGKRIILSTGMADFGEIKHAIDILVTSGTTKKNITVLQCNTGYPTPMEDVNLSAMLTIEKAFGVNIGYSDHTNGYEAAVAAAALGARTIEKHFTLDRGMKGPDHIASLEPAELKDMVAAIRNVRKAIGDGVKRATPSELKNKRAVRKSIVAACDIRKGEVFTERNITTKRPGGFLSPMKWDEVVGRKAKKNFKHNEVITL